MENPTFEIDGKKHSGLRLDVSPAGLSRHHCYRGGYVEHVISTANIAMAMCLSVEEVYEGKVNRDLVIAGILIHDIFKPITYVENQDGSFSSSHLADYLDHLSLVIIELSRRRFPLELVHLAAAHHGNYGPISPHTIEALICHLSDLTDSRLNGQVLSAAKYLSTKAAGEQLQGLTSKEAFGIVQSKANKGWTDVKRIIDEIRRNRRQQKT